MKPSLTIEIGGGDAAEAGEYDCDSLAKALQTMLDALKAGKKKEACEAFCMAVEMCHGHGGEY